MIENEQQYIITRQQWTKFNEAILRLKRCPLSKVPKLLGDKDDMPGGDVGNFLLAECELNALGSVRDELQQEMDEYDRRVNGDRKGTWMPLYSGVRFWPEDPRPQDINITDIAHALAALNRFNGHTRKPYSVAQHAILVSHVLPGPLKLFGLLHDAGECYLGDVISPVKHLIREFYEPLEEAVMKAVALKYGFSNVFENESAVAVVKRADLIILATEVRDLTTAGFVTQPIEELPLDTTISECLSPEVAEKHFLEEFALLTE